MAVTKYVPCPNCKEKNLGPYTVDTPTIHKTGGNCPHCGKRYTVEYGKNKIKSIFVKTEIKNFPRKIFSVQYIIFACRIEFLEKIIVEV